MNESLIEINEEKVKDHLGKFVKETVEETLNQLLETEADMICNAQKYEHTPDRLDTRAGHYQRKLQTRAGEITLKMPKLRKLPFDTAIIERYKRREISVEESMIEMYLAGVSVRRVEDITEALWGTKVSPGTISNLNKKIYDQIHKWRMRPLEKEYRYVYVDGVWLKRSWGGEIKNVSILIAVGVSEDGFRDIIGVSEGLKEDKESWKSFLRELKDRGLQGVELFISDKSLGLIESLPEFFPEAKWQRCIVHFYRNVFHVIPRGKIKEVALMLKAIHAQENRAEAKIKAKSVVEKLKKIKLNKAAEIIESGVDETLNYYYFPEEHWRRIRTNNPLERIIKEVRRRTRVVGAFPDGESALILTAARLRYIASRKWGLKKYLSFENISESEEKAG